MVSQLARNITKVNSRIELSVSRSTATKLWYQNGSEVVSCLLRQPRGVATAVFPRQN